ncbi:putative cytoplasmic protein [Escherichia coli]|nr:putative cytoplasmic protein [Escherichia coli]STP75907.1 putative cytoplasmic protein [Escherichia coli]VEA81912.1 putative cytoplasmic protein [Escherichia coli]
MIRLNRAMVIAYWSTASGRAVSKKTDLALDEWDKEITPSTELRKAFHGEVVDYATFREQYLAELAQHEQEGKRLADIAKKQPLTLLYSAKNTTQNHALVLADWLRSL